MHTEKTNRLELPQIFQNNMVLQREKAIPIRGRAAEGISTVTVVLEEQCVKAEVENGAFFCEFPPQEAGTGKMLCFYVNEEPAPVRVINNISFGDVWLACGQSNMEYFLRYDANWNEMKREPFNPDIHMFNVPRIAFEGQEKDVWDSGHWFLQGDPEWAVFSAPGYCFAREIQETQNIPVGVVGCNWGGTPACAWMEESYLKEEPVNVWVKEYEEALAAITDEEAFREECMRALEFENSYRYELEWRAMMYGLTFEEQQRYMKEHEGDPVLPMGPYHHYRPGGLYHTMIETFAPFPVKGILWYQGESDNVHADIYDQVMERLVQCFRDTFRDPELPFLFVQIAPYERWLDDTGVNYPRLRMAQDRAAHKIPYAWMTSLTDIGDKDDIHPKFKREVGHRLALLARGKVYGEDILCEVPELAGAQAVTPDARKIRLTFLDAQGGFRLGKEPEAPFHVFRNGKPVMICSVEAEGESLVLNLATGTDHAAVDKAVLSSSADSPEFAQEPSAYQEQDKEDLLKNRTLISFAEVPYCEVQIWNQAGLPLKPFRCIV